MCRWIITGGGSVGIGFVKKKSRGPKIESKGDRGGSSLYSIHRRATILRAARIWHAEYVWNTWLSAFHATRATPWNYSERWSILYLGWIWNSHEKEEISSLFSGLFWTAGKLNSFFFFFLYLAWPIESVGNASLYRMDETSIGEVWGQEIRNLSIFFQRR